MTSKIRYHTNIPEQTWINMDEFKTLDKRIKKQNTTLSIKILAIWSLILSSKKLSTSYSLSYWVVGTFLANKKYGLLGVILILNKCSENEVYDRHFEKITLLEKMLIVCLEMSLGIIKHYQKLSYILPFLR